jgi:hypothetical protein
LDAAQVVRDYDRRIGRPCGIVGLGLREPGGLDAHECEYLVEARLTAAGQRAALSEKAALVVFTPTGTMPKRSTTSLRSLFRNIQLS